MLAEARVVRQMSGSGVELDTLALFDRVVSRATTVAVIVIVAELSAASVPSEHETVRSQVPWLWIGASTSLRRPGRSDR